MQKLIKSNQSGKLAGCLCFIFLFPICMSVSMWIALALGPMGCALPNRCSRSEETFKGVLSILVLFGGGVGIPIAVSSLVGKGVKAGSAILSEERKKPEKESNMDSE